MMNLFPRCLGFFAFILFTVGCSSGGGSGEGSPGVTISVKAGVTSSSTLQRAITDGVLQSESTGLTSLKYYIKSIRICESLTVSGSGYSNPSGCLTLYSGTENSAYDSTDTSANYASLAATARADTSSGFIDLMSTAGRAALASNTSLTEADARSYSWGIIDWYLPIKVTAEVMNVAGTEKLYTKDGTTTGTSGGGNYFYTTTATNDAFATSPAEEAVILLPNGGSWFRFQNPFVISASDVSNRTAYTLDLVFNPAGLITGQKPEASNQPVLKDGVQSISAPFLNLTPVPRKSTQSSRVEIYRFTNGSMPVDLRVGLYSIDGESTVYGVETKSLFTSSTTTSNVLADFQKVSFVTANGDGSLNLKDYAEVNLITNLVRATTEGASTTATLHCSSQFNFTGCADGATLSLTGTLVRYSTL